MNEIIQRKKHNDPSVTEINPRNKIFHMNPQLWSQGNYTKRDFMDLNPDILPILFMSKQ